jgi:hypothetical protein
MTTPPTPAGWYPDPDGSRGQRYWDGSAWTEHRSPEPARAAGSAEPPGSEQPTAVVKLPPSGEHVGAHRAPEATPDPADPTSQPTPEPTPESRPESAPEPEPGPTAVIDLSSVPSEQATSVIRRTPAEASPPTGEPSTAGASFGSAPPPGEPSFGSGPLTPPPAGAYEPPSDDARRKLILGFGAACAALLVVLVAVVVYGVFFNKPDTVAVPSGRTSTTESATPTTQSGSGWGNGTQTTSESPTAASGSGPQATDGGLTFAVTGVETAPSVPIGDGSQEQTAQGEYLIVHLNVLNASDQPLSYVGMWQKLNAGGTAYVIDDVATASLKGTSAQLNPSDSVDLAIAFDVPPGTSPESLEVHADPSTAGAQIPLS